MLSGCMCFWLGRTGANKSAKPRARALAFIALIISREFPLPRACGRRLISRALTALALRSICRSSCAHRITSSQPASGSSVRLGDVERERHAEGACHHFVPVETRESEVEISIQKWRCEVETSRGTMQQVFRPERWQEVRGKDRRSERDAWLRTHVRVGGRIVKIAPYAMTIVGTVGQWSQWTGMTFANSGDVEVAGALSPVRICLEQDYGVYVEPGVWVHHGL